MRRRNSGYPRTSYGRAGISRGPTTSRSGGLTRRTLLGLATVIGASGIVELFRSPGQRSAATTPHSKQLLPHPTPGAGNQAAVAPATSSHDRVTHTPPNGPGPHHGTGDSPPPHHGTAKVHHPAERHASGQAHHHHSSHQPRLTAKERARIRREEHVDLPAAVVRVRKHPIYDIADIDPHAPKHAIALTIDDGPDPDWTPKVLRLLDKHHMQASFCVVGVHAAAYPRLIRDIHKAGHVLVNHSYTHVQPFARQTEKRIVAEITKTQRAIERAAKVSPELFRAPGGEWSHFVFRAIASYGLTPLDWDVDPEDWSRPGTKRIERAMLRSRPGEIVLCHDGGGNRGQTVRALRKVLPVWKHRGYVTIPLVLPGRS
jgi:peptidoglycan/xylan/chitin deacetylase (PgdA/CDA1 family)